MGRWFPVTLADFDTIVSRLDKQGSIEENVIFVDRNFSFSIDDMLAAQNSYGATVLLMVFSKTIRIWLLTWASPDSVEVMISTSLIGNT
jgi:hypothetical protein